MRLKQYLQWRLPDSMKSLGMYFLIYNGVVLSLFLLFAVMSAGGSVTISMGGSDMASMIYLLVIGIISFGYGLRCGLSNGVSRKTVFCGELIAMISLTLALTLGSMLISALYGLIGTGELVLPMLYQRAASGAPPPPLVFALGFCSGLFVLALGQFIGGAYYRMSKLAKILVSVFVPIGLVLGLPMLAVNLPHDIQRRLGQIFIALMEFLSSSPLNLSVFLLLLAAVLLFLTWLLMRRAPAKAPMK